MKVENDLSALKEIINDLLKLHSVTIELATQGKFKYKDKVYECVVSKSKVKTSSMVAMIAGQSVKTILKMSDWRGLPVRDIYPIARSILESHVNAAYIIAEDDSVAERAIRHVEYASYKQDNRQDGVGEYALTISTNESIDESLLSEFKKNKNWTTLNVPDRIRKTGELTGKMAAVSLVGSYSLIYPISSEIIHGSPYGFNFFFQAYRSKGSGLEKLKEASAKHIKDILIAVILAISGYLSAFFITYGIENLETENQILWNKAMAIGAT
ncbi:hypothetical protein GALL_61930 [mine drainage metagenome]|uniref:Uncharacterized protein n=1 Tax=mine drainage metagenome TaxID=410659 RepID=A0A1J5TKF4_9ZZZZ